MSTDQPDFENVDAAEVHEQERREQAEAEAERRERHEDEQSILNSIREERVTVELKGTEMEFKRFMGDTEDWLDQLSEKYQGGDFEGTDEEDLDDERLSEFNRDKQRIIDILAEHNVDEGRFGPDFWAELPSELRFEVISQIRQGGQETARAGN